MAKDKEKDGAESEEEVEETEDTEEAEADDESAEDESEEEESEDEDESEEKDSDKEEELDLDAELEKERKAGEPDPAIAEKAFKERQGKKKEGAEDGENKTITQKDLDEALARDRKERQLSDALAYAKELAGSDKEAELIVAKWVNRTFPKTLSLREQISEAFVITHSKKLIGERNEALRGLKGKFGVNKNSADTHRDANKGAGNEPKLSPADAAAIKASGFVWNNKSRQFEKKLPNGRLLIRDTKTKQVRLLKK
jgi:hypothetical protein